jgi:cell filamentation protein
MKAANISEGTCLGGPTVSRNDRYDMSDLPEAQFEPGSDDRVLKNRLGITSTEEMDLAEARALERTMDVLVRTYGETHRFTAADLCECHRLWLGDLYEWAGRYRQVNVSKDGFPFAAAAQVPALMDEFERGVLRRCTPCTFADRAEVVRALAETHVELVLIHPFRDGNGRLARVLMTLMALQAGLPLLDFSVVAGKSKDAYIAAIQAGLEKRYAPMEKLVAEVIEQSRASS